MELPPLHAGSPFAAAWSKNALHSLRCLRYQNVALDPPFLLFPWAQQIHRPSRSLQTAELGGQGFPKSACGFSLHKRHPEPLKNSSSIGRAQISGCKPFLKSYQVIPVRRKVKKPHILKTGNCYLKIIQPYSYSPLDKPTSVLMILKD